MSGFKTHKWLQLCSVLCLFHYIHCDCFLPELDFPNGEVILPPLDENGTFAEELSIIQFICFDDYMRIGVEYIQCLFEKWTDNVPFCAGLRCSAPPEVENATYITKSLTNGLKAGSFVEYKCNEGYVLENVNASSLQCFVKNNSEMAVWRGELPHCIEKTSCPDPGVSKHGRKSGTCCTSGDVLKFRCRSNYDLVGDKEIRCLRSGRWSSNRPLCKARKGVCELPPVIPHGVINGTKIGDFFAQYEKASLVCHPGYKVNGSSESKCLGRSWDKEFGTCEEIFCDAPEPIEHGTIRELKAYDGSTFPFKFAITYICDKGYKFVSGDSWSICGRRGWSGKKPRCEVVECPNPGNPDNGIMRGNNYSVGATVGFSCFAGYELLGSLERHCLPNGQWDGELARCNIESNYCPDPGTPIRGSKNSTEYKMGDRVRFQCSSKLRMVGSDIRECLPNRTWSGKETKCLSYYDYDDDAEVSVILKSVVAEKAAIQKEELDKYYEAVQSMNGSGMADVGKTLDLNYNGRIILYFAFDVSGSVGANNLKKSIEFAKAIVRKVGISSKGAHAGALTFSSKSDILFWPMTLTTTKEVLDALDDIKFTGGGTSASSALKAIREQHMPLVREWIPGVNVKNVLFILTDGKANMDGNPAKEADLLKAEGVEIFCIGITGDVNQELLFDIASSSKYGKDEQERPNVFILQSYDTLAWLVHEITNGTIDYSDCGLGVDNVGVQKGKIYGGDISKNPWPWMAALFMKVGNEIPVQRTFQCGGSIIHPRFILTAAHCVFTDKGKTERQPSDIIVKIGLTHLKNKTAQEIEVRRIIYHEQYSTTYNNDIALLELDRRIEFNAHIRPICLPPKEKGDLYKPQFTIWATGWGEEKPRNKTDDRIPMMSRILREIQLPIQAREVCKSSLEDEQPPLDMYFTNRMFCAGDGQGKKDTCKGDSGGPVMQSAVNKDGHPIWIQVGVISWGLGCGQKAEYGFYTHVHELMPWIEDRIKNP